MGTIERQHTHPTRDEMKLLTKAIEAKLAKTPLYATDSIPVEEKKIIVKFFTPWTNWTWYVFEGERSASGDWEFFGLVQSPSCQDGELGYFTLSELESINGPFRLKIERDRHFYGKIGQ